MKRRAFSSEYLSIFGIKKDSKKIYDTRFWSLKDD